MRKPRSDSKLAGLPEQQLGELHVWFQQNLPYFEIQKRLKERMGVSVSQSSISAYWTAVGGPVLRDVRRRAVALADEIATDAEKHPGRLDKATLDAVKQRCFEMSIKPNADPGEIKSLFGLVLKARDQVLDEKQFTLDREKFEVEMCENFLVWFKDSKAREIAESSRSNSEKIVALRKAFLSDVDAMEKAGSVKLPE